MPREEMRWLGLIELGTDCGFCGFVVMMVQMPWLVCLSVVWLAGMGARVGFVVVMVIWEAHVVCGG